MSGTLYPTKLTLKGFRSFRDEVTFTFPPNGKGAILIKGKYAGSEVSSGSGKSTIGIAISYAMGFNSIPATRLKNWYAPKGFLCELTLTDGVTEFVITRDPKLKLEIKGSDPKVLEGTAAETKLSEIVRIPLDLAEILTYRRQREPGKFITQSDSEKKEFGITLLGLKEVETAYDEKLTEIASVKIKKESCERDIQYARTTLQSNPLNLQDFETAKKNYEEAQKRVNLLQNKERQSELTTRYNQAQAELTKAQQVNYNSANVTNENVQIRNAVLALQSEIETLLKSMCPTCKREWNQFQEVLAAREQTKQTYLAKMGTNLEWLKNAKPIIESIPHLQAALQGINQEIANQNAPLADAMRAFEATKTALIGMTQRDNYRKQLEAGIILKEQETTVLNRELTILEHTATIISRNGFLGSLFDEFLFDVETRTNDMISEMPNLLGFALSLSSTTVNKNGNVKKSISTTVYKDGKEIPVPDISGGQAMALELFADLAVSESVRQRSGSPLGWVFLDETMSALDNETKRAALEVVKTKVNGLILIVDHATEIKEGFESVISIEFDGKNSRATQ